MLIIYILTNCVGGISVVLVVCVVFCSVIGRTTEIPPTQLDNIHIISIACKHR
jgi:hypothetical protein